MVHIATLSVALGIFNQPSVAEGVGTGIVLDLEGHILTNNHVVENAQEIIVTLGTSESFNAQVVGLDPITDTAVIRIEATDLTPATLGGLVGARGRRGRDRYRARPRAAGRAHGQQGSGERPGTGDRDRP